MKYELKLSFDLENMDLDRVEDVYQFDHPPLLPLVGDVASSQDSAAKGPVVSRHLAYSKKDDTCYVTIACGPYDRADIDLE